MKPEPTGCPPRNVIARQLAVGFGLVSAVAVIMCGMLLWKIAEVSDFVRDMRQAERGIRDSSRLSSAIREQYIHLAHSVLEPEVDHLGHYEEWRQRVLEAVERLSPNARDANRERLRRIKEASAAMDRLYKAELLPALRRDDLLAATDAHNRAEDVSEQASGLADEVESSLEFGMAESHTDATRATTFGLIGGGLCVALVVGLSIAYTIRLRRWVLKPLAALTEAAQQFGSGDFSVRVGQLGRGELRTLAQAFDRMVGELAQRERRLVDSERMAAIGQLAAGVAHEMNNPIGIIRGYLKTMSDESDPDVLRREVRILDEEASACQRIADQLLTYAHMPQLERGSVSMVPFLNEAIERLAETPEVADHRLEIDADQGQVNADATRLRQVIANLVINAAQASPKGTPIRLTGRALTDGEYEISVSDQGSGIPAEHRGTIFEPFFSRRSGGTGLGLAVCQGIVHAHGGTIVAETNEPRGMTFRVRLPIAATPRNKPQ